MKFSSFPGAAWMCSCAGVRPRSRHHRKRSPTSCSWRQCRTFCSIVERRAKAGVVSICIARASGFSVFGFTKWNMLCPFETLALFLRTSDLQLSQSNPDIMPRASAYSAFHLRVSAPSGCALSDAWHPGQKAPHPEFMIGRLPRPSFFRGPSFSF